MTRLAIMLVFALFTLPAYAGSVPFEITGYTAPPRAANGFPFTYSINVKLTGEVSLQELGRRLEIQGQFTDGTNSISPRGSRWVFPLSSDRGLIQYLFIIPEGLPRSMMKFEGSVIYRAPGEDPVALPLKPLELANGGPWAVNPRDLGL